MAFVAVGSYPEPGKTLVSVVIAATAKFFEFVGPVASPTQTERAPEAGFQPQPRAIAAAGG